MDELDHLAESQRPGRRILRRGAGPGTRLQRNRESELLLRIPRRRTGLLEAGLLLGNAAGRLWQRRRRLHGLQRLGESLDVDQGLVRQSRTDGIWCGLAEEVGGPSARRPLPGPSAPADRGAAR